MRKARRSLRSKHKFRRASKRSTRFYRCAPANYRLDCIRSARKKDDYNVLKIARYLSKVIDGRKSRNIRCLRFRYDSTERI